MRDPERVYPMRTPRVVSPKGDRGGLDAVRAQGKGLGPKWSRIRIALGEIETLDLPRQRRSARVT